MKEERKGGKVRKRKKTDPVVALIINKTRERKNMEDRKNLMLIKGVLKGRKQDDLKKLTIEKQ